VRGLSVLVVDDHESVRTSVQRLLDREGFCVVSASSAEEALRMCAVREYDVVLSDLQMRGMSGCGLFRALRASGCRSKLVLMSGSQASERERQAGVEDCVIKKPFRREEVVQVLRSLSASEKERPHEEGVWTLGDRRSRLG
ncbi:MAG: response regulator, partial [Planctomycetes bacterium]|nr:response regulator [Planctomycetota bacterium]